MPRITVLLNRDEEQALIQLALADLRVPNVEARFLLREELMRRGALKPTVAPADAESPATTPSNGAPAQDVGVASGGD